MSDKVKYFLILTAFLTVFFNAQAQNYSSEIRELIAQMESPNTSDTQKMYLGNQIAWLLRNTSPGVAVKYSTEAGIYAKQFADYNELAKAYSFTGVCYRNLENYSEALENYQFGLQVAQTHSLRDEEAYAYINIGNLLLYQEDYPLCQDNLFKALNIGRQLADSAILAYVYINLGRSYIGQKKYVEAEDYLRKSLEIRIKSRAPLTQQITVRKYIGDVYAGKKELIKAKHTYLECFKLYPANENYDLLSDMSAKVSGVYLENKQYDSALYYGNEALKYAKLLGSKLRIRVAYNTLGAVFYANGNYKDAALNYYNQSLYNDSVFWDLLAQKQQNIKMTAERDINKFRDSATFYREKSDSQALIIKLLVLLFICVGLGLFFYFRYRVSKSETENIRLSAENTKSSDDISRLEAELAKQAQSMKYQQLQLSDNISYAYNIQKMLLPESDKFGMFFKEKFIYYNPLDIVSGDFYWCFDNQEFEMLAVADCSGHDIKGSFLSLYGINALHDIVSDGEIAASKILEELKLRVKSLLYMIYPSGNDISADSMDIALIVINKNTKMLEYSGSNIPMYYIREDQIFQLKQIKNSINLFSKDVPYEPQFLQLQEGDCIYMASDGYCSQFGHKNRDEFRIDFFEEMLLKIYKFDMTKQREVVEKQFLEWKGGENQNDDILVTGFRV
ncbi:MAG: tetratricopeptide repeat protein [Bacteroidales bacterium]|nr:tetratricopeptide repeat protein [Bacteroidales bacterium]